MPSACRVPLRGCPPASATSRALPLPVPVAVRLRAPLASPTTSGQYPPPHQDGRTSGGGTSRRRMRTPQHMTLVYICRLALAWLLAVHAALPLPTALAYPTQLTPGAATIESRFPNAHAVSAIAPGYPTRSLAPLKASVITVSSELMERAGAAFRATETTFDMDVTVRGTNVLTKRDIVTGSFDLSVGTLGPTPADYNALPTLTHFPLHGNAIVFTYRLGVGTAITGGMALALDGLTLCRIHTGDITRWDDPAITATNPGMTWSTAAGKNITLMLLSVGSATHLTLATFCSKVDPHFAATIPVSNLPAYPSTLQARYYDDLDLMNSAVWDTPFCLAVSTLANVAALGLPVGAMVNVNGVPVLPSSNAMALTMFELATDGFPEGQTAFDLTHTTTPQAWPMMSMSYLFLDSQEAVSTCANKRTLVKFLQFFYTSDVVRSIAAAVSVGALPQVFVSQLRLLERLQSELTCLGEPLMSTVMTRGTVAVDPLAMDLMTLYASFYLSIDTTITLSSSASFQQLAVQRVAMGENALALVNTAALTDEDVSLLKEGMSALIPGFIVGVSPIFRLPNQLLEFAALESTADLGLPALYPIKVDMELTAQLFLGMIPHWTHASLTNLNPQLIPWFNASGAPTRLRLLVGATAANDALSGAKLLWQHLQGTPAAAANPWAFVPRVAKTGPASNPFVLVAARLNADPDRANMSMIESENRLYLKLQTMSGAVSYRILTDIPDITTEFQFVDFKNGRALVPSNVASLRKCGSRLTSPPGLADMSADEQLAQMTNMALPATQRNWVDAINREKGCWPLSTMLSFAAKLSYSSVTSATACMQGLRALEFIKYIQSSQVLSGPAQSLGLARLADHDLVHRMSVRTLQQAMCDGSTLMVVLPKFWTVGSSISSFAQAAGGICLAVMLVSMGLVVNYRHKVVIRSSSTPFLVVILLGMSLLLSAAIAWGVEATRASCSAFLWLANLGFMLLFTPLFAKTWRVWRIFSGSHLRIVKIGNQKLLLGTAIVIAADLILIAVWQGMAPLIPIEYDRVISSEQHVFTHCSVQSSGSGLVFVGLVAAEKAGLLLFGAVMAFSTRNVKGTFNESAAISWTIYNTLLTLIIGVVIIVFVGAVENTLMILVIILLLWIVGSAWGLIFLPKFHMLFQSDEKMIEMSRSEIAQEKSNGFSFASIAVMTAGQVKAYYQSLKLQVNKAERVLQLPLTKWAAVTASQWSGPEDTMGSPTSLPGASQLGLPAPRDPQHSRQASGSTAAGVGYDASAYAADKSPAGRDPESLRERGILSSPTQLNPDRSLTPQSNLSTNGARPVTGTVTVASPGSHPAHRALFISTPHAATINAQHPTGSTPKGAGNGSAV